jgi:hypothetical protein
VRWFFLVNIIGCPAFCVLAAACWHTGRPELFSFTATMATMTLVANVALALGATQDAPTADMPEDADDTVWPGPRPGKDKP